MDAGHHSADGSALELEEDRATGQASWAGRWLRRRLPVLGADDFEQSHHRRLPMALAPRLKVEHLRVPLAHGSGAAVLVESKAARSQGLVIFLHGLGDDAVYPQWHTFDAFCREGLAVLSIDWDGHGQGNDSQLDFADAAAHLAGLLAFLITPLCHEEREIRRQVSMAFAAHSAGAALLLDGLRERGDTTADGVLLISPALHIEPLVGGLHELSTYVSPGFLRHLPEVHRVYGARGLLPAFGPVGRTRFPVRLRSDGNYIEEFQDFLALRFSQRRVGDGAVPMIWFHGAEDYLAPLSRVRARMPEAATPRSMPGMTHLGMALSPRCATLYAVHLSRLLGLSRTRLQAASEAFGGFASGRRPALASVAY